MKKSLGFYGSYNTYINNKKVYNFPKDYTKEKYIILPEYLSFGEYYKQVGSLPVILISSEVEYKHLDFIPFGVNIFLRDKIYKAIEKGFGTNIQELGKKCIKEMNYYEERK